ncbi:MAG: hypothetical protein HEQ23_09345 [Tepidisphaera sp.]
MTFRDLDVLLESARRQLNSLSPHSQNPEELEFFIVSHVLFAVYARFERAVATATRSRINRCQDKHLLNFMKISTERGTGKIKLSDLGDILFKFDPSCKEQFVARVDDTALNTPWDTIVINRNSLAHGGSSQLTLMDIETAYPRAVVVLSSFCDALGLTPAEKAKVTT